MPLELLDLSLECILQLVLLRRIGGLLYLIEDALEGLNTFCNFLERFIDFLLQFPLGHCERAKCEGRGVAAVSDAGAKE